MNHRYRVQSRLPLVASALLVVATASSAIAPRPAAAQVAPPEGFLPDTAIVVRVADRVTTARDFVRAYFNAYAPDRPAPDSAGRVEFMNSIVNKELLGLEATRIARPLVFEDRLVLREFTDRLLSNMLFQRQVIDSVTTTEAQLRRAYQGFRRDLHLRHILFRDPESAERVRRELAAKRVTWDAAVRRESRDAATRDKGGDIGWKTRSQADPMMAAEVWELPVGGISKPYLDSDGFHLVQVVAERPGATPAFSAIRTFIDGQLREREIQVRSEALRARLRAEIGMTYDSTNIEFASSRFEENVQVATQGSNTEITLNTTLPTFGPEDTSRVLARYRDGVFSLGRFIHLYSDITPVGRPNVNTFELMRQAVDGMVLEPWMARAAVERGLDRDPFVVAQIARRTEQIRVEHLYQDSVMTRVWVSSAERRAYYEKNLAQFFTFPKVRFAIFALDDSASAAAMVARLRAGEDAQRILADSLHGFTHGSIQTRQQNEHGPFQKLLFENLRPGQAAVDGPARDGAWFAIQLLEYDPGRQLSYDESVGILDESLQNQKAEALLNALVERLRQRHPIMTRPDAVMRIRLVDEG